jgi:DNA-binding transcriptional LysR family regulator
LTLNQLKIFDVVATHLNITKAAKEIRISQPSISKQIRLLEEEYNTKFHTKVPEGVRLTNQGLLFWRAIQPILQQLEDVKKTFGERSQFNKTLLLGATQSPSVSLIPRVLKLFQQAHPEIKSVVRTGDSRVLEQMLLRHEVDLAIITHPSHHPRTVVEHLSTVEITAVVSASHPLAKKRKLRPDDVANAQFVFRLGGKIATFLKQKGINVKVAMQCESAEGVKAAIESGVGIGLVYREHIELSLKSGQVKLIKIPWLGKIDLEWFIIYRKDERLSPPIQDFIRFLYNYRK